MSWRRQATELPLSVGDSLPGLEADLDRVLLALCVQWGFCNQLSGRQLIAAGGTLTADAFARAVVTAEGFANPENERDWMRRIGGAFVTRYGSVLAVAAR